MKEQNLKKKTVSGLFWKMAEQIGSQLIRMLTMIVLARVLMPEDYGAIALVWVFISLSDVVLKSGLASPLIQKKDADSLDFSTIFYCSFSLSFVLVAIIYFSAPAIARFYDMDVLCPVLRALSVIIPICSVASIQNAYVSRCMKFRTFFFATLIGLITSGAVGIWMAYHGYGIWSLVGQTITNHFVNLVVVFLFIRWLPTKEFSWTRLRQMWSFGWKVFVASLINSIFSDLRTILIGKVYTKQDLAYYNQGNQYPQMVVMTVNSSINAVLFPAIAKIQDDIAGVRAFLRRSIKLGSFIMFPLLLGFAATAKPLVLLLLTEKWLPSVPFIQVMCLALFLAPVSTPSQQAIKAIGRSDVTMRQELIKKSVYLALVIIGLCISIWGVVIGSAIGEIWCVLVNTFPCKKHLGYSFRNQLADILPNLLTAGFMAVVVYFVSYLFTSPLMSLLVQIPLGIILYIGIAAISKNESYIYCKNEILSFIAKRKG